MYDQTQGDILFTILYSVVMAMAMLSGCYLLFSKANAFVPAITPLARLRRWTGVFLVSIALNHMWYMQLFFLSSSEDIMMVDLVGGLIQSVTILPVAIVVLLAMLQDRRRPLWPFAVMTAPVVLGLAACVVDRSKALFPVIYAYDLPLIIGIITYMVRALRQYGRWLRDNYADLEHKEIWHSFVVLAIILLAFTINELCDKDQVYEYVMLGVTSILICYLLWRAETLSDLSTQLSSVEDGSGMGKFPTTETDDYGEHPSPKDHPQTTLANTGQLLQRHCIDTQLYLQHDLNISQLAKAIGTNRFYLSQYFSAQGITYNAYINNLRINHFTRLYSEAVAANRPFTAQQLAGESGYRSYSTFRLAFKQRMGRNVREWMHDMIQKSQD
jgi:AraC-like DNA-binding protein